ncbi:MAG: hypothetical protein AAFP99_00365 [Pseudomonadota bacterium]
MIVEKIALPLMASALLALVGCQSSGTSTDSATTTSSVPVLEDAAGITPDTATEGEVPAPSASGAESKPTAEAGNETETETAVVNPAPTAEPAKPKSEREVLEAAVRQIATIEKERGSQVAFQRVFQCYQRAKERDASKRLAKACAAQDFVLSRSYRDANTKRDSLTIIAERAPQRIGALMELKGVQQAEFNRFGFFLNSVALPTYKQASL